VIGEHVLRQIIVIFVWLSGLYLPAAQAADAASAETIGQQIRNAPKRGALFKIRRADNTLFLFGTIHVGQPDFYPLESVLTKALTQSSKLALELDPRNTQAAQQAVLQYGLYPKGSSLQLDPALQARLSVVLKKYGMPFAAVTQMKPWMVVLMLTMQEYAFEAYESELAADIYLADFARAQKKPVIELETIQGQLAVFDKPTAAEQLRFLEETIADIESSKSKEKVEQIIRAWREADAVALDALAKEMAEDATFSGKFLQRELLDARNPGLADNLEKLMRGEKQVFAGIGVLHLVGTGSVPALLRQRGYTVERVY
jgi:uncharacterized protein